MVAPFPSVSNPIVAEHRSKLPAAGPVTATKICRPCSSRSLNQQTELKAGISMSRAGRMLSLVTDRTFISPARIRSVLPVRQPAANASSATDQEIPFVLDMMRLMDMP